MVDVANEVDLRPDPRILPMLGEINLTQWRCLAELVDNGVDGFLSVGRDRVDAEIHIDLPTRDVASARVTVSDNGPGMTAEHLEQAMRAGWTGNSPIESLGMFGMGFNIATARLGTVTTVWTSCPEDTEEHGLRIDFDELRKQRHFRTPRLSRPKADPRQSGTTVTIEQLKPDQRAWFAKPGNRSRAKKELAKAYAAMLRQYGDPMSFRLILNGRKVPAIVHCVWDEERSVETARHGTVGAVQRIDRRLSDRPFCTDCWQWLPASEDLCPSCGEVGAVVQRKRHVHGWIGLQRYLSPTAYGIDFIRNGRKIEIGNRDLFVWRDPEDESEEPEYPIDDPRQRGRFVGEIHLDHCRVTYMKDRFDRTDPAWDEMVGIVRGEGPLQPQKAASLGYPHNDSPLFKLFQAFRRSSPHRARVAGGWSSVLVVKDNDRAAEMAKRFHEGAAEYQTDEKWWELIVEEDNRLLTPPSVGGDENEDDETLADFSVEDDEEAPTGDEEEGGASPSRVPIPSLTRKYQDELSGMRWEVEAYSVEPVDPELGGPRQPWNLVMRPEGSALFVLNPKHRIFRSATMTELDALLAQLAYQVMDFTREEPQSPSFGEVLSCFRDRYAGTLKLDPIALSNGAELVLRRIARAWLSGLDTDDASEMFEELPSGDREAIQHRMAARSVPKPQRAIAEGRFLEYAPTRVVVDFVVMHPELFFDGPCWEEPYSELDYGTSSATEDARRRVLEYYESLLRDAQWLAEQDGNDLELASKERILRAMLSVDLLAPTGDEEEAPTD